MVKFWLIWCWNLMGFRSILIGFSVRSDPNFWFEHWPFFFMELGLILTKFWSKSSTLGFNIGQILVDPGWISKWKIIKERQNYWNFGWLLHRMLVSIQLQKSQVFRRIHQFDNNQYSFVSTGIPPASIDFLYERYLWLFVSNIHCIDCLDNVR